MSCWKAAEKIKLLKSWKIGKNKGQTSRNMENREESEQNLETGKAREEPARRKWWELEETIMRGSSMFSSISVDGFGKEAMAGSQGFGLSCWDEARTLIVSPAGCHCTSASDEQPTIFCTRDLQFLGS